MNYAPHPLFNFEVIIDCKRQKDGNKELNRVFYKFKVCINK